ncbi:MAG: rane protein of unknown function [Candidatus Saccharibacteria bacterium]|nr:rane protein of unknown function [Candidatus Saccharibacteria bacterium]
MSKFKLAVITLALSFTALLGATTLTPAFADLKGDACSGLQQLNSAQTCGPNSNGGINSLVKSVVTILSYIVGIVAVIMVIISGLKYILASGDPSNVTSAKNTLLYAIVGLFIAALAQAIVHFALSAAK